MPSTRPRARSTLTIAQRALRGVLGMLFTSNLGGVWLGAKATALARTATVGCALCSLLATRKRWPLPCCLAFAAAQPLWHDALPPVAAGFGASLAWSVLAWFGASFLTASVTSYVG